MSVVYRWMAAGGIGLALAAGAINFRLADRSSAERADATTAKLDATGQRMLAALRAKMLAPDALVKELHLAPTDVVADVGAGPGLLTLPLARAVPRGRVIATDINEQYLDVAYLRARSAGLDNVSILQVPGYEPGLAPASIDVAVLCQVDHYLRDRAVYFRKLRQALRPGGRIVLINLGRYRQNDLDAAAASSLRVAGEWKPSAPLFALVLSSQEVSP